LIVDLIDLMERGEVPTAPIFLDSPLAIRATEAFRRHSSSLDPDIDLDRILSSPHLHFTETVDESKSTAKLTGFHIIICCWLPQNSATQHRISISRLKFRIFAAVWQPK
jgi:metallo-beta-lactamase family protein